ncbi:hypothetical protein DCD76_19200, partial [Acinetobacter baumannii]
RIDRVADNRKVPRIFLPVAVERKAVRLERVLAIGRRHRRRAAHEGERVGGEGRTALPRVVAADVENAALERRRVPE